MTIRINGFSGFDVDSMVTKLMTAKRIPLDKLNQQKTYLSWQRDSYREMNSKMFDFKQNKLTDTFNKSIAMTTRQATVSGNKDAIKVEVSGEATGVPMTVTVLKVGTKANIAPKGPMMVEPAGADPVANPGKKAALTTTLDKLNGGSAPADGNPETFRLTINNTELKFSSKDSISTVIGTINSSKAGVVASFDEVSGEFSLTAKEFGSPKIVVAEKYADSKMLQLLNLNPAENNNAAEEGVVNVSTVSADGSTVVNTFTTNKNNAVTVNGVTITLLQKSDSTNPSTITTTIDPSKAVDTIKSFIQSYNDLLNTLNNKVDEAKYREFTPLTDEQKTSMKESEITSWEAKAKSGLLKNDDILKEAINSMRSIISSKMGQLSALGITSGEYFEGGKLYLNEDKLKAVLMTNPQEATSLFQGNSDAKDGIFSKLNAAMTNSMQKFSDRAGTNKYSGDLSSVFKSESVMGKKLKDYTSQISKLTTRLNDAETRYYKQFSAMETAMNKLQSQSSSLFGSSS
ncbi:flagellar filament capping protein FliD [Paenibacillus pini]|uniref:Flagellar hook-associated protein 2 n=1 Tax=Paenibacillus pini JCM 16418 TaxID=1236976 RepID=W7YQ72_9BACL|nr:flagellar filament capping protein FliD [Paenibacillus pini]GAF10697.1 flagellar hook-associated protein FliD [Paenibacillus pini JCM 16418]